jgi:hypothetical protein
MIDKFIAKYSSLLEYTKGLETVTGKSAFVVPYAEDYLAELRGASMSTTETSPRIHVNSNCMWECNDCGADLGSPLIPAMLHTCANAPLLLPTAQDAIVTEVE